MLKRQSRLVRGEARGALVLRGEARGALVLRVVLVLALRGCTVRRLFSASTATSGLTATSLLTEHCYVYSHLMCLVYKAHGPKEAL